MGMKENDFRECCFKTLPNKGRKVVWEITHKCEFRCNYCFQEKKRLANPVRVLHINDLLKICKKLSSLNAQDVILSGGEIYFVKDTLKELCEELTNLKIKFSFSTTFLRDLEFIDFLLALAPRALNVSLDPPQFENLSKDSENLTQIKRILQRADNKSVDVKITGIITRGNIKLFNSYLATVNEMCDNYPSLSAVYITNPYDIGYLKDNIRASETDIRKTLKGINESLKSQKIKYINFHRFNAPLQTCPAGAKILHIEPNGNAFPCHLFANLNEEVFKMGNLLNDSAEIIGKSLDHFGNETSEAVKEYKSLSDGCKSCRKINKCGGGCIAEIISLGKLIEPQLVCKKLKPKKPEMLLEPNQQTELFRSKLEDLTEEEEKVIIAHIQQKLRKGHDLAHGFDHIKCVVKLSRKIAKCEGANLRIVTAAAYFHDFEPRRKLIYKVHTQVSAKKAISFLQTLNFPDDEVRKIYHCIDTSSYGSSELNYTPNTIEAKCVRDADWLDAIGARGIARVFAFASAHGCEELGDVKWDISNPPRKRMSLIGADPSPIYHFFSKLLWVKDGMMTETGRKLAENRHERLLRFLKEYKEEMELNENVE